MNKDGLKYGSRIYFMKHNDNNFDSRYFHEKTQDDNYYYKSNYAIQVDKDGNKL